MPFYNLRCKVCGHEFEKYASISERADIVCPECGKKKLETVMGNTSAAVIIKNEAKGANACPNAHICGGCCHHGQG